MTANIFPKASPAVSAGPFGDQPGSDSAGWTDRAAELALRAFMSMDRAVGSDRRTRIAADGCTDIQGYLISEPIAPEQIEEFLSSRSKNAARKAQLA